MLKMSQTLLLDLPHDFYKKDEVIKAQFFVDYELLAWRLVDGNAKRM